jgi:AraC-like DNA-binding protein
MKLENVYIEPPRQADDGIELFIQPNGPHEVACQAHIHNTIELLYITSGSYSITVDGVDYLARPGDLLLFCSNAIHNVYTNDSPENSYYVIKTSPSLLLSISGRDNGAEYAMRFALNRKDRKILWHRDEMSADMKKAIDELTEEYENDKYAKDLSIKLKITALLIAIMRESTDTYSDVGGQTAELIYQVMTYVRNHFDEDIDERDIAASVGLSYSYFSRCFKRITGMSFKQHLSITRINQAEKMLCSSNLSISEVAIACGYNSISYFISVFKKITGRTPKSAHHSANKGASSI